MLAEKLQFLWNLLMKQRTRTVSRNLWHRSFAFVQGLNIESL